MIWKPKEKELTAEEAVALARKELRRLWFGSAPLIAGVTEGQRTTAYPLDPSFSSDIWILFFVDPTEFSGLNVIVTAKEWFRRYNPHGLRAILVVRYPIKEMWSPASVEYLIRHYQIQFPVVVDEDGVLAKAFSVQNYPMSVLLSKRKTIAAGRAKSGGDSSWLMELELDIQKFLRSTDPGLPLLPVKEFSQGKIKEVLKMDFGKGQDASLKGVAKQPEKMNSGEVYLSGKWEQTERYITTSDPSAAMGLISPGARVSVLANFLSKASLPAILGVEVNGVPAYESFFGQDLAGDDDGKIAVKINTGRLFHVLAGLTEADRQITFRFPQADRARVVLYGLRFGD